MTNRVSHGLSWQRRSAFASSCCLAVAAVAALLACAPKADRRATIGVLLPATGQYSRIGELVREGIDLAVIELGQNRDADELQLTFRIADTEGKPAVARRSFLDLVERQDAVAILGSVLTADTKGFIEEIDQHRIPVLANGSSAPELRGKSPYFFRNWPADDYEGYEMAAFARSSLGLKRVAALVADDPYPRGVLRAFSAAFNERGGRVVSEDVYEPGLTNLDASVRKILQKDPEALYAVGFPAELAAIVRIARGLRPDMKLLSAVGVEAPEFFNVAAGVADGLFYTAPIVTEGSIPYLRFRQAFEQQYGKEPEIAAAISYDAVMLLATACRKTTCTRDAIREWLANLGTYEGASGITTFDDRGDVMKPIAIKRIEGGHSVVVKAVRRGA